MILQKDLSNAWNDPLFVSALSLPLNEFSVCLNRKFICLRSCHCGEITSFSFDIFLWCVCLNRLNFGFASEHLVTSFFAVADGRLRSLPIIALTFQTLLCYFRRSLSFGLSPLRLLKALSFQSFSWFLFRCGFFPVADGDVLYGPTVAAPDSAITPTINLC